MKRTWRVVHWLVIVNFVLQIFYGFYMVFFAIGGGKWPLFAKAVNTPLEVILKRRLYSVETWVAIAGLAVYLAITEILPKRIMIQQEEEAA
jgi:hypothetical protein